MSEFLHETPNSKTFTAHFDVTPEIFGVFRLRLHRLLSLHPDAQPSVAGDNAYFEELVAAGLPAEAQIGKHLEVTDGSGLVTRVEYYEVYNEAAAMAEGNPKLTGLLSFEALPEGLTEMVEAHFYLQQDNTIEADVNIRILEGSELSTELLAFCDKFEKPGEEYGDSNLHAISHTIDQLIPTD